MASPDFDFDKARELLASTDVQKEAFNEWLHKRRAVLEERAEIVDTCVGPIQYKKRGCRGPVVICLHGAFGGYDQAFLMGSFLVEQGFTVIAPSRPGYLGTPIAAGTSAEKQAEATAALMNALGIEKAAIYGFSSGSIVAFQFGVLYPERATCVVLTGVGVPKGDLDKYNFVRCLLMNPLLDFDLLTYCLYVPLLAPECLPVTLAILMAADSKLKDPKRQERADHILANEVQHKWAMEFATSLTPMNDRREGAIADLKDVDPWQRYEKAHQLANYKPHTLIIDAEQDNNGSYPETVDIASKLPKANVCLHPVADSGHFIWLGINTLEWQAKMIDYLKEHRS